MLKPIGQIDFYARLQAVRQRFLSDALRRTVEDPAFVLDNLNSELSAFIAAEHLKRLASFGLRGEVFCPVPYLLSRNPYLLGYYRLLYGFSCKAFYDQGPFKRFQPLENAGAIPHGSADLLSALCRSLAKTGELLLQPIGSVSLSVVNELQVLTLGTQFRGGGNVKIGQNAVCSFFDLLRRLVAPYGPKVEKGKISLLNDSGLAVTIRAASDPDISITLQLETEVRKLVAIEIKGGKGISNFWERIGAAEKSQLKARNRGFNELWTITRVDVNSDPTLFAKAREQLPPPPGSFVLI